MAGKIEAQKALGRAVRDFRKQRELSQEALADISGLHRTYVGGVERGERNPTYTSIVRLAEALDVRPATLVDRADQLS